MPADSSRSQRTRTVLSPHLQIYRLPLTALLSITHRISGCLLAISFVLGNGLLAIAATDPQLFENITGWLARPMGLVSISALVLLFNYHLIHGVRHLFWDFGYGFSRSKQRVIGILEIVSALGMTALMLLAPSLLEAAAHP